MPKYPNGYIPRNELVSIDGGRLATRGTAARWESLKADVLKNEGVRLRITDGENAYRSFTGQQLARKNACAAGRCGDAAMPGTSSHGGSLNGKDAGAIDVDNWALLGKEKFYAYCRRNGFEPGYFSWEPWHIIDWAPYTVPSSGGGGSQPSGGDSSVTPTPEEMRETDMDYLFQVDPKTDGRWVVANYRKGTMRVIPNGFQLDQLRAEKSMKDADPLFEFNGPQTPDKIAGLTII